MPAGRWMKFACAILLVLAPAVFAGAAQAQNRIGVVATAQNQVFGGGQPISTGAGVYAQEVIKTGDASSASLQFVDQTNLNIGARSEVTLDRFVYDPNRGNGNVVLNTGKGVFRFVSGTQDHNSYHINTPVATIGVRGTSFHFMNSATATILVLHSGDVIIKSKVTGETIVVHPGFTVVVYANGKTDTFPSNETSTVLQKAGLDQNLLQEYAGFIGPSISSNLGGLPPMEPGGEGVGCRHHCGTHGNYPPGNHYHSRYWWWHHHHPSWWWRSHGRP